MSNGVASNAGVGRALFSTRFQLSLQAVWMCLKVGALPGLILPFVLWFSTASPREIDIVKLSLVANLANPEQCSEWQIRGKHGYYQLVAGVTKQGEVTTSLTPRQVRQALQKEWWAVNFFALVVTSALICSILGFFLVWLFLSYLGKSSQKNRRIRGALEHVTSKVLDGLVRKKDPGDYKIVNVTMPSKAPVVGILVKGTQGSGKSLAIHDLMRQVFAKGRKSIIHDPSGEFFSAYYRPGKDFFFNPALEGSVPWSIFSELKYIYDADTLAQAFLPPKAGVVQGASAFFEDAARALFSVALLRLAEHGAQNTSDIAKAIFEMPEDEMEHLIQKSVASSAMGGDSKGQRQGVISSIAIYFNGIATVGDGNWSVRDFIEADDDARFFIVGTDDTCAMFAPLYRLLLNVAFAAVASKQEIVHTDRYWFFIDETDKLGDIKLDERLSQLRKYGVCIVSGIQSESQFVASLGKERAETVMNCFNSILMLRMNAPEMMDKDERRLGKVDMDIVSQNQALAVKEWRDGAGMAKSEQKRELVMASQIGDLAPCTGYLKLVGAYPAAFVDYQHWMPKKPGASCYADAFAAIQELPPRDPKFLLRRKWAAGSVNPLKIISEATKAKLIKQDAEIVPEHSTVAITLGVTKPEVDAKKNMKSVAVTPDLLVDLVRGVE
ncbi:MAG: type IV secretion system DNA-binding domain-containing protein [Ottowia sp.]|nr:type IV secretion system DNA-binding domain-containing protein [Ottowia sp.]